MFFPAAGTEVTHHPASRAGLGARHDYRAQIEKLGAAVEITMPAA